MSEKADQNNGDSRLGENPAAGSAGNAASTANGPGAEGTNPGGNQPAQPAQKFKEPVILEAVINPNEKPKETKTPFSFTTPQAIHQSQAQPTKGDLAMKEQSVVQEKAKITLEQLDAEIAAEAKDGKTYTIDDYHDTASMFIEGWEALFTFVSRMISKDHTDSAYQFGKDKKERLIHQAMKVSRKNNWVLPIEYMFVGTLVPATGAILLKASDKRKEYMQKLKTDAAAPGSEQIANIPLEITKGGPNKGFPKRRGPGNPR